MTTDSRQAQPPSRLRAARGKARTIKAVSAVAAAGTFAIVLGAAREAHPGGAAASQEQAVVVAEWTWVPDVGETRDAQGFFGSGAIAPSGAGFPQTGTQTS